MRARPTASILSYINRERCPLLDREGGVAWVGIGWTICYIHFACGGSRLSFDQRLGPLLCYSKHRHVQSKRQLTRLASCGGISWRDGVPVRSPVRWTRDTPRLAVAPTSEKRQDYILLVNNNPNIPCELGRRTLPEQPALGRGTLSSPVNHHRPR